MHILDENLSGLLPWTQVSHNSKFAQFSASSFCCSNNSFTYLPQDTFKQLYKYCPSKRIFQYFIFCHASWVESVLPMPTANAVSSVHLLSNKNHTTKKSASELEEPWTFSSSWFSFLSILHEFAITALIRVERSRTSISFRTLSADGRHGKWILMSCIKTCINVL